MPHPTSHAHPRARNTPALAALAVAVGLALAGQAHAATFTVTTNADSGVGSLRDAVTQANATPGADAIVFDAGIGAVIALEEELVIRESLTITGPGLGALALDGGGTTRIFSIAPESLDPPTDLAATISGLTLRNGFADNDGGCVLAAFADVALVDSRVTGCDAGEGRGGGIAVFELYFGPPPKGVDAPLRTSLVLSGTEVSGNTADRGGGGVSVRIASYGIADGPVLQLLDSTVSGNTAGDNGGGVHFFTYLDADLELRDSVISGNTATIPSGKGSTVGGGGGLAVEQRYVGTGSSVVIADAQFLDNTATLQSYGYSYGSQGGGGGVWLGTGATIDVSGSRFERNSVVEAGPVKRRDKGLATGVPFVGGGLGLTFRYGSSLPALNVRDSAFVDNTAPYGGGFGTVLIFSSAPPKVAVPPMPLRGDPAIATRMRDAYRARAASAKGVLATPGVAITDTSFTGNSAEGGAAAMNFMIDFAVLGPPPVKRGLAAPRTLFERVTMSGNTATFGPALGAGALMSASIGPVTRVVDSTVSGNTGGGILVATAFAEGEQFTLDHGTLVDNGSFGLATNYTPVGGPPTRWTTAALAGRKAYAAQGEPLAVRNTIATGNLDEKGAARDFITDEDTRFTLLHSLVGMAQADLGPFADAGGNQFGVDPLLGPLADNGGPTRTHLPLAGSPAINAGDPDFAEPPSVDQRGEPRVVGAALDIGAVEVAAALPEPGTVQFDPPLPSLIVEVNPTAALVVTRTGGTDGVATVAYATNGITATPGADYVETSGTLTWADGDGEPKTVPITVIDDTLDEADETVGVTLSNATGAALGAYIATTLTIVDDDAAAVPGVLGFSATAVSVDEAAGTATLSVARTGGDDGAVSVAFASGNGTATAGADYTAASGTLTWADGDSAPKTLTVPILDDTLDEADETFGVTLSAPTGGATLGAAAATVTILDNDLPPPPGVVQFDGADEDGVLRLRIEEDGSVAAPSKGLLVIQVTRSEGSAGPASVDYATVEGTATAPEDFAATAGTLTWADGETGPKPIAVPIVEDDGVAEPDETFGIVLSNAEGAGISGDPVAEIIIVANGIVEPGAPAAPNVIPANDWSGKLALFGALLLAGWVALRRRFS